MPELYRELLAECRAGGVRRYDSRVIDNTILCITVHHELPVDAAAHMNTFV